MDKNVNSHVVIKKGLYLAFTKNNNNIFVKICQKNVNGLRYVWFIFLKFVFEIREYNFGDFLKIVFVI